MTATNRYNLRRLIPSMFQRRLLLLASGTLAVLVLLVAQMVRLTVVEAAVWRQKAESALTQRRLIPTARGQILDRRMRVLAADRLSYDVCVRYPVITGDWAYTQARQAAYAANKAVWPQIREEDRLQLIAMYQQPYDEQVQRLWQTLGELSHSTSREIKQQRDTVIRRVKQIASTVWDRRLQARLEEEDGGSVSLDDVAQPISEQTAAHPIVHDIDHAALIRVQSAIAQAAQRSDMAVWGQVSVEAARQRDYPLETITLVIDRNNLPSPLTRADPLEVPVEGAGLHLIGAMRRIWKEDVDRRPFRRTDEQGRTTIDLGGYLPGDTTGNWGIEKSQEDRLRGARGQTVSHLDTLRQQRHEPQAGGDVVLTVDIQLQARLQAIMDPSFGLMKVQRWHHDGPRKDPLEPQPGQPLNGAAVVLDVAQSQVLAAVSIPGFSRRQLLEDPASVWNDQVNHPFVNRAVARSYQPGSTVKPLVLAAAITDRKLGLDQSIECRGHLDPQFTDRYRCWIYKSYHSTHGPLDGAEALARSCNIFFYTLGRRLGAQRLVRWYDRLGLGKTTASGLREEVGGILPDLEKAGLPNAPGFNTSDAIFMAIGQGPVQWTALQAAGSYAALARGGYLISPSFVMVGDAQQQQDGVDLHLDPRGIELAMRGLHDVVAQPYGSANGLTLLDHEPIFNIQGVRVFAKSGTAQGTPLWVDTDGDGRYSKTTDRIARRGDHSWVICLVQKPGSIRPDYVVAVVVEYGGSGAAVAGPIANQILHALRAEGYL